MIGTRVLVGSLLALAAVGVLIGDGYLSPWFPCLFVCLMAAGVLAARELVRLFPESYRPSRTLVTTGVLLCLAANWYPTTRHELGLRDRLALAVRGVRLHRDTRRGVPARDVPLPRTRARSSRDSGPRCCAVAYLGLLPCFFVQLRFLESSHTGLLLALTIFVPKCNDIAAFFTGTFLGRTR